MKYLLLLIIFCSNAFAGNISDLVTESEKKPTDTEVLLAQSVACAEGYERYCIVNAFGGTKWEYMADLLEDAQKTGKLDAVDSARVAGALAKLKQKH